MRAAVCGPELVAMRQKGGTSTGVEVVALRPLTPPVGAQAISEAIEFRDFLGAATIDGRIAQVNQIAGTRLFSHQLAQVWTAWVAAMTGRLEEAQRRCLAKEILVLSPNAPAAQGLFESLVRGWDPLPPDSVVFMIVSCRKYASKARWLRSRLVERGARVWIVTGDAQAQEVTWQTEDVVLPIPDTYEALPLKVFKGIEALVERHGPVAIVKIDDDCDLTADFQVDDFQQLARQHEYVGEPCSDPLHDRVWHHGKTSRPMGVYARRFIGPWARGGCYLLGRGASQMLARESMLFPGEFASEYYEDKAVGDVLRRQGVALHAMPNVTGFGVRVDMAERFEVPLASGSPPISESHSTVADRAAVDNPDVPVLVTPPSIGRPGSKLPGAGNLTICPSGVAMNQSIAGQYQPIAADPTRTGECAEAVLSALPRPIAVVGNGAMPRDFGPVIDSYPTVLRLNNFVIEGFEDRVGRLTSARITNGWSDIRLQHEVAELSPFAAHRAEASELAAYRRRGGQSITLADTDVAVLLPGVPKPSTGLALLALLNHLGIEVDAFGFDGFKTGHYWDDVAMENVHADNELELLLGLPTVTLMGASYDYASLYDFCHTRHEGYNFNEGLRLFQAIRLKLAGERILEFGAGNGELSAHLQRNGNAVTAMEVSEVAFNRIPVADKLRGDCLDLSVLAARTAVPFDRFVSIDVLEHLTENDIRIVLRAAAQSCTSMLVSASTRPSGLLGPRGENLHLTVKSVQWWLAALERHFIVTAVAPGIETGQVIFEGRSRRHGVPAAGPASHLLPTPPTAARLALPAGYTGRNRPEYYVDSVETDANVTWQPDVYPAAARLAQSLGCRTLIDIGCGHGRKLGSLAQDFEIIGVDYGPNITHCRRTHRFGTWLEADFECALPLPIPATTLAQSVVVCSDVIEHLVNPMALLALLKQLISHAAAIVLSTPDRIRTHGASHRGPPPNHSHTREWAHDELGVLLREAGFEVAMLGHTRSNDACDDQATILAVLVNPTHPAMLVSITDKAASIEVTHPGDLDAATSPAESPRTEPTGGLSSAVSDLPSDLAVAATPTVPAEYASSPADAWLAMAKAHRDLGEVEAFERSLAQAFAIDARHAPSLRFLAGLQLDGGDPAEAAWLYDELLSGGNVDAETIEGAVLAHWRAGDLKTATLRLLAHG